MNVFKEIDSPERTRENDHLIMSETDLSHLSPDAKVSDISFSDLSETFEAAFRNFGLVTDTTKKRAILNESNENKDYSDFLEKGDDGKYYSTETGKAFESVEAWEKAQETLAKRYESTTEFYERKAKKEWARFKNAEENGESDAEKWEHYRHSQEYYAKAEENKEKAQITWAKLGKENDAPSENNSDSLGKEYQRSPERREYSGQELLYKTKISSESLSQEAGNHEDAEQVKILCDRISNSANRDDEVEATGRLLPVYQRLMYENGYENEEELCNAEGLNWGDIYDDEPSTYGDEYQRGFIDCIDDDKNPSIVDREGCNEAYYQGILDAHEC